MQPHREKEYEKWFRLKVKKTGRQERPRFIEDFDQCVCTLHCFTVIFYLRNCSIVLIIGQTVI